MTQSPHALHHSPRHLPSAMLLSLITVAFPLVPGVSDASRGGMEAAARYQVAAPSRALRRPGCTPGFVCSGPGQRAGRPARIDGRAVLRLAMAMGATLR
ncbi:MAG TPA: hypothetical protein ENI96_05865 [Sedimenticola thiotaurini]|uniref:Uncharacterized protein n=1 Tax=Sedimenticola thiotaurini TaxID=1543721 RepID=A0A831RM37_9GAMM|nr:hypothetical protein [Sedimenticola thiotaurini]